MRLKVCEQVSDQYANGDIDRGAWLEYQNKLQKAKQHLEDLEKAQKDFGTAAAQAIKEAGAQIEEYGGKVEGVGKKLMPVSGVAAATGTALPRSTGAGQLFGGKHCRAGRETGNCI